MVEEAHFFLGSEIVDRVIVGNADWSELFAKHDFFHKYRYYLQIIASARTPELQIKWYAPSPVEVCAQFIYTHSQVRHSRVKDSAVSHEA